MGMRTLRQSALRKLAEGVTTVEEVLRVTGVG
jgi:type II secretory ATPase GspE/PulE/Tfp pilus assembly ATPase PilB-like protein